MFHRVDEPLDLPSSRFFQHAARLEVRGGAVTVARAAGPRPPADDWTEVTYSPPTSDSPIAEGTADDIAAIAAMSQTPGFPSIGYSGG